MHDDIPLADGRVVNDEFRSPFSQAEAAALLSVQIFMHVLHYIYSAAWRNA